MTRLRLAAMSVAVVLFSSAIASADPYNAMTTTTVGAGLSNGSVSAAFLPANGGGGASHSGFAGVFSTKIDPNGATFQTFCAELTGILVQNSSVQTVVDGVPPATPAPDGTGYISNTTDILQRAAWVIGYTGNLLSGASANLIAAAKQLAVWDILYDAGTSDPGDVLTYGHGAYGFSGTGYSDGTGSGTSLANSLLSASYNQSSSGVLFRQNLTFTGYDPVTGKPTYTGSGGQSVLAAVPEPSTFAIAGLGALGMFGYGLKRRKLS